MMKTSSFIITLVCAFAWADRAPLGDSHSGVTARGGRAVATDKEIRSTYTSKDFTHCGKELPTYRSGVTLMNVKVVLEKNGRFRKPKRDEVGKCEVIAVENGQVLGMLVPRLAEKTGSNKVDRSLYTVVPGELLGNKEMKGLPFVMLPDEDPEGEPYWLVAPCALIKKKDKNKTNIEFLAMVSDSEASDDNVILPLNHVDFETDYRGDTNENEGWT